MTIFDCSITHFFDHSIVIETKKKVGIVFSECKPKIRRCKFKSNWSCQNIFFFNLHSCFYRSWSKTAQFNSFIIRMAFNLNGQSHLSEFKSKCDPNAQWILKIMCLVTSSIWPYEKFHYFTSINIKTMKTSLKIFMLFMIFTHFFIFYSTFP